MAAFLLHDLRIGWRGLARNPAWTAVAVLSLALGIGANTAVFSFVDAVLLHPFPYKDSDRLVLIWGTKSFDVKRGLPPPEWEPLLKDTTAFESTGGVQLFTERRSFGADENATAITAEVSPNIFAVLGARPLLGQAFSPDAVDAQDAVIISYGLWKSHFGGDEKVIGRTIQFDDRLRTVVGVMPEEFFFPDQHVQVWVPAARDFPVHILARLKLGVTVEQARAQLDTISARLANASGDKYALQPGIYPLHDVVIGQYRLALWTLLAALGMVLLIGCANVANLLLARGVTREKEFAVRVTLGASRWSLFRQLVVESLLLGLLGGAVGILLAQWGLSAIRALDLRDIPRMERAVLNGPVLLFALGLSLVTGLIFGLVPAWSASRPNLQDSLKQGGFNAGRAGRSQLRDLLVAFEFALSIVLLVGAGLLVNSFVRLAHADWGFRPDHTLMLSLKLPDSIAHSLPQQIEFSEAVVGRLRRLPGVEAVGMGYGVPLESDGLQIMRLAIQGRTATEDWFEAWVVGPGYMRALGVPILQGREFNEADGSPSAPRVVVVSKALADKLWPGENPVGKRIDLMDQKQPDSKTKAAIKRDMRLAYSYWKDPKNYEKAESREVVGVVPNVRMFGLEHEPTPAFYRDYRQKVPSRQWLSRAASHQYVLRTEGDPLKLAEAAKGEIWAVDRGAIVRTVTTMEALVQRSIGGRGTNKLLLVVAILFGSLALVLAAGGIYGVMAHAVSQRTQEFGVRVALGAQPSDILRLVVRQGMRLVGSGTALGLAGAWAVTRVLDKLLFGVKPTDLPTYVMVLTFLILVALVACYLPARRATRVDPMVALRYE